MLDAQTIATVKSTLPAVAAVGPELTRHFYDRLLSHHPELKNVFNMSNQRNGDQREALFNAIAAYASNLENLAVLLPAVEKIAQKHTSLNIKPEQYAVVGEHLLATIQELMDPGEEVLAAWGRAYGVLADVFIRREESIYQQSETANGGWRGTRAFRISAITAQSSVIKSIELTPVDGAAVVDFRPGQYLSLYVQAEGMANRQIRQYSLTATPNGSNYRIAVKHESAGTVSGWLHEQAKVGDVVELAAPHGDFFLDVDAQTPVALISAGVGQTPMLAMLHQLESQHHAAPVTWLHASENGQQHAFAAEVTQAGKNLAHFSQHIWYRAPEINDSGRFDQQGLMDLSQVSAAIASENQQFYLCGPLGFMQFVAGQLRDAGVAAERIHYEVFGPHKVV